MSTQSHKFEFKRGRIRVTVTEAPEVVYIAIAGARLRLRDVAKFQRFLFPIVDRYRDDPRRLEFSGEHAGFSGHVESTRGGGWLGYLRQLPRRNQ